MTPQTVRQTPMLRPLPLWTAPLGGILVLLVVAGGVAFLLAGSGPLPLDTWWFTRVAAEPGSFWYSVATALAKIGGSRGALVCFATAVAALIILHRRRDALTVALASIFGVIGSEVLKRAVQRARPPEQLYTASGYSYPSGHSMAAAALAVSILLVVLGARDLGVRTRRVATIAAIAWVLAMMWSRTALHVHWLSDTVAGAMLGIGMTLLVRSLCVPTRVESRA